MKKIFLVLIMATVAECAFAQSRADVDAVVDRFRYYYNHEQWDSIFNMLSDRSKELMPMDKTKQIFNSLTLQLGELKTYEYTKEQPPLTFYKTVFSKSTLTLLVSVNKDNKLETFRFLPYKEDTTPAIHEKSNIVLKTKAGDIYGTLTMPEGNKKTPVVLIIAGSGPTDRNGNSDQGGLKSNAYKLIADSLQRAGVASVRYDKRGIGESGAAMKIEDSTRFDDMVNDACGFIKMLKEDPRFSKVIVLGHSEGSLIGMIAARKEKATAYISLAGIAERADLIIEQQLRAQSGELAAEAKIILDSLDEGHLVKDVDVSLYSLFRPSIQPYMISWLKYNPAQEIKKLTIPVLILQGTTDMQVDTKEAEKLKKAYPKATLKLINGMNHALKQATDNYAQNVATYSKPDLPLSPELMPAILKFVTSPK